MQKTAAKELPEVAQIDYKGQSREFMNAGGAVLFTFAMALLIVYLVLAAQFESFIHPFVIMLTVPLAVTGALLGLWIAGKTLNLFSQIGIVMLVGLAAKNGILIVDFANKLRDEGRSVREAILEAASVRLRPILMTSIATVAGAVPLVISADRIRQPLGDRRRRDLRRDVFNRALALCRAFLLCAARAVHGSPERVRRNRAPRD
jgi:multidrug efflux pump